MHKNKIAKLKGNIPSLQLLWNHCENDSMMFFDSQERSIILNKKEIL
jgi:hypothetical protein